MTLPRSLLVLVFTGLSAAVQAQTIDITPVTITEWKPVYAQIETRDRVPARARIGGTIASLEVTEGDTVTAGQRIAVIEDVKLGFRIDAVDARLEALQARLETARADLARGEQLIERGVITSQRLEALQTAVDVLRGDIASLEAERLVLEQQIAEGDVLAPDEGLVLSVPVSRGSVVIPGEALATIGGGGFFLRLDVPERHATDLAEGDRIEIGTSGSQRSGTLAKLYPRIEGGRVQADIEVEGLAPDFVGRRIPVRLPVGERRSILVPESVLSKSGGLDFVIVETEAGPLRRVVVPGDEIVRDGVVWREILSGLGAGDRIVTGHD